MNALAGLILGALVGVIIVLGLEWLESGVLRTPEDVERVLALNVLGAIPPAESEKAAASRRAGQTKNPVPQT